jgi:hypothetical protein
MNYTTPRSKPAPIVAKIIKTRGSFPDGDAALKLLYLAVKNAPGIVRPMPCVSLRCGSS